MEQKYQHKMAWNLTCEPFADGNVSIFVKKKRMWICNMQLNHVRSHVIQEYEVRESRVWMVGSAVSLDSMVVEFWLQLEGIFFSSDIEWDMS